MAPFKLKFRMGNSRSTSQENDSDQNNHHQQQQQQHQSNNGQQIGISNSFFNLNGSSTTTIDSDQNTDSCISYNNDRRALLQNQSSGDQQIGFINPTISQNYIETNSDIPLSPPPSYEHVLEENRLAEIDRQQEHQLISNNSETCNSSLNDNISCTAMATNQSSQENLLECSGSCDPLYNPRTDDEDDENNEEEEHQQCSSDGNSMQNDGNENNCTNDSRRNSYQQNTNDNSQQQQQQQQQTNDNEINEYIDNKSSKELYKAVAKEWGIQCKMSDGCRCMECQSHYFDCEYDDNEHQKTDGGLGAGTPMFISEVMHGSACTIL